MYYLIMSKETFFNNIIVNIWLKLKFCLNNFQPINFHCQWHDTPPITSNRTWTGDLILHKGQPLFFSSTKSHSPSPFNLHVHITLKKVNIPFNDLWDLWLGGQKVKKLAEIFMVDVRILYVLVVKISDFFYFFEIYVPFQK
jgi:hypothetical protein